MDTNDFMEALKRFLEENPGFTPGMGGVPDLKTSDGGVAGGPPDLVNLHKDGKGPLVGFIVFYVNIGQMPPANAEKYLKRTMDSYKKVLERMPTDYAALWVPSRARETSIEVIRF